MKIMQYLLAASLVISMESLAMSENRSKNNQQITVYDKEFIVSIHHKDIKKRIKEIAQQISKDYVGKKPIFIGVLNGAFIFLADLVREIDLECELEIDFIKISSYGNSTRSSGTVTLSKDLSSNIIDRDIIIVEDIIDSGLSITFARDYISKANPRSIRIVTLLDKTLSQLGFPIDYVGFKISPLFVVGYGLDYAQRGRDLKSIYELAE